MACFAAGTKLKWEYGWKAIEAFRVGDLVWSRDEHDPHGPLVLKRVEELFRRFAKILHLHAGGRVIRTTAEHPFYAKGTGWTPAGALRAGDEVWTDDGRWVGVEEVYDTGEYEPVYNLRVADFHTYFVGDDSWGWGIWAHNADCAVRVTKYGSVQALRGTGADGTGPRRWQNLIRIPKDATVEPWKPVPGGASKGIKFKWEEGGVTYRVRIHNADPSAPAGSNASQGWVMRVFQGKRPMDSNGTIHPPGVLNQNSPFYNEATANSTHMPIDPGGFLMGG